MNSVCTTKHKYKTRIYVDRGTGCMFLEASAKLLKATISFVMSDRLSVRPHGTTRLPLDGFS